jgi:hypothetical protein
MRFYIVNVAELYSIVTISGSTNVPICLLSAFYIFIISNVKVY